MSALDTMSCYSPGIENQPVFRYVTGVEPPTINTIVFLDLNISYLVHSEYCRSVIFKILYQRGVYSTISRQKVLLVLVGPFGHNAPMKVN